MSVLSNVKTGPTREPLRILAHGQEGVGKTTWAAGCPGVLFLTAEDGGGDLDYARVVLATWPELRATVRELISDSGPYRAVCIDTIDSFERLLWDHVVRKAGVATIEEVGGGYGKGYTAATEEMTALSRDLDLLRSKRGVAVIILAHSHVKPFNDPLGNPFDRYELRLHKGTSALWLGWSDCCLFMCFDVTVKTARRNAAIDVKGKAVDARRVVYTSKDAAYDAKNRYNLPEELALDWKAFAKAIRWDERHTLQSKAPAPSATTTTPAPTQPTTSASQGGVEKISSDTLAELIDRLHDRVRHMTGYENIDQGTVVAASRCLTPGGVALADLSENVARKILAALPQRTDEQLLAKLATPLAEAGNIPF